MSPKIHAEFWTDPDLEDVSPEVRLAVLWMISNPMTHYTGTFEVSPKRFAFETGLHPSWLEKALEAVPRMVVRAGSTVWLRTFIKHQFGQGDKLRRNNMGKAVASAVEDLPAVIREAVWVAYPELKGLASPSKPLPSPSKGLASPSDVANSDHLEALRSPCPPLTKPSEGVRIGIGVGTSTGTEEGSAEGGHTSPPAPLPVGRGEGGVGPGGLDRVEGFIPNHSGLRFDLANECLAFLNKKTGADFKAGPAVLRLIAERLAEVGQDADGVKVMITRQAQVWAPPSRLTAFLQPHTLFEEKKFHSYFGARLAAVVLDAGEVLGRIKKLREQIETSPANRESRWHSAEATEADRENLKKCRRELSALNQKTNN